MTWRTCTPRWGPAAACTWRGRGRGAAAPPPGARAPALTARHLCRPPQVHEAIRADPAAKPKARSKPADAKRWKEVKLTYEQVGVGTGTRHQRVTLLSCMCLARALLLALLPP